MSVIALLNRAKNGRQRQNGAAAVEFALIAIVFFALLFGIIEFGRLFFLWNTLQEVTRKAAREAVVRDFSTAEIESIKREALFRMGATSEVWLVFAPEVSDMRINIEYLTQLYPTRTPANPRPLDGADNILACEDEARKYTECIRYVEVKVCVQRNDVCVGQVPYVPMIGWWLSPSSDGSRQIYFPLSTVTMPAESLGYRQANR